MYGLTFVAAVKTLRLACPPRLSLPSPYPVRREECGLGVKEWRKQTWTETGRTGPQNERVASRVLASNGRINPQLFPSPLAQHLAPANQNKQPRTQADNRLAVSCPPIEAILRDTDKG